MELYTEREFLFVEDPSDQMRWLQFEWICWRKQEEIFDRPWVDRLSISKSGERE